MKRQREARPVAPLGAHYVVDPEDMTIRRRRGTVTPTRSRNTVDPRGHAAPLSGVDNTGAPWNGTSRVVDLAARRRANRRSWAKAKARTRRATLTLIRGGLDGAVVDEATFDGGDAA